MPREPPDAADDLRKQMLSQLAFGQLKNEVPGTSNEAPAGLLKSRCWRLVRDQPWMGRGKTSRRKR